MSSPDLLGSLPPSGTAVIVGGSGALGGAFTRLAKQSGRFTDVVGLSRQSVPIIDLTREATIEAAAAHLRDTRAPLRLVVDATGFLHGPGAMPEKTWRELAPARLAEAFAINAIGPALLMKHLLPLLAREGKTVFATLSARVGSIADNRLGGWYGYRASKAALNQFVRTAAIELARTRPAAICVALHPGTVDSALSRPFSKTGLDVRCPGEAAADLIAVIDALSADRSGGFYDYNGKEIPW